MRKCRVKKEELKQRRDQLRKRLLDSSSDQENLCFILPSQEEVVRNRDVHHLYRQESSMYYFTGFEEPESIMVFCPGQTPEYTMFVREKDVERETWDGFRFGLDGIKEEFAADEAYNIKDFTKKMPELLKNTQTIFCQKHINGHFDRQMTDIYLGLQSSIGRKGNSLPAWKDSSELIGEIRLRKSAEEISLMRKASELSAKAHIAAMRFTRPGVNERQVLAVLNYHMVMEGAAREGYGSIVATGKNATTLHYTFNDQKCRDGDLLLIDAGGEYEYYTADITRTFPVNGKFTDTQRIFYQNVLEVQNKIIEMSKPGIEFSSLQDTTINLLTDSLLELNILKGSRQEIIDKKLFRKYYPHGVSHWLGMDVHDVGASELSGKSRVLEKDMSYTIEPGLYVPFDDELAPKEFRGLGVRIEDDILLTADGHENMTSDVPKSVEGMEAIIGTE